MVDSFLKYLQFEKRLSANTVLAYQSDLLQFSEFLLSTFNEQLPEKADHGMIRTWIVTLVETKLDPRSVNRKIASLRAFFKYLLKHDAIKKDPMLKITALKTKKKLPAFVKENEMLTLLDNQTFSDTFQNMRIKLILELFYATGIRLSELLTLKETEIDFASRTLKVVGKRNKERVIPFSSQLVTILKGYREMKNREVEKKNDLLLVTDSGDPCYPGMIYRIVKRHLSQFTTADKQSPHVLRHSYATHLLDHGAEINAVKDLLGHTSLAATQVYTHNSMEKLKKVFERAHPKA
jgi:integrase/recombinase XerC